jgi:hypothetical protein
MPENPDETLPRAALFFSERAAKIGEDEQLVRQSTFAK